MKWVLALLLVMGAAACGGRTDSSRNLTVIGAARHDPTHFSAIVTRDTDGDTIHVQLRGGAKETVRVLGVDTPETHKPNTPVQCYGPEASAFTKAYAVGVVTLTTEPSTGDVRDRYGRMLAYVYVLAHRRDLGTILIQRGYARVYAFRGRHFSKRARYERLEAQAKAREVGRWGAC
jgi:endonuclease YncB( thermonuclease family)